MHAVMKKIRMPVEEDVLIMNAPAQYIEEVFSVVEDRLHTASQGKYSFVNLFVHSIAELECYASDAVEALTQGGLLWIAYPKKSSSIKTDISRDYGWDVMEKAEFEGVSLISIDETWSAMRFRSAHETTRKKSKKASTLSANKVKKELTMPEELLLAFKENPQAKEAFEKLAPSYQKGFIEWIVSAKRADTKQKRIILTIEKVKGGMKAPYNKK
ncbi:YdeI/OmpD-associated family protein [Priestia taiwanensis]|uniref:Bacteriocin-protection, YdeI or OmpD-Associated n=1 Tax=Priestia taiwanensis TaxID=1347902 RepID=A0A917AYI3_9BACI|nr:YdeI/OmpD-associated family protein [Priestia taiwanensis]MBM7365234.1 hypothetical protein [Priestia taiwanensis]GGE85533.1 hypothetical protein GCM10007140_38670 [Priestia taiwanensis]